MNQMTFSDMEYSVRKRITQKEKFLREMNDITTIGASAFEQCTALTEFTLNSKVKAIGAKAFYKCKKLSKMIIKTTKLSDKTIGEKAFDGLYKNAVFKCPKNKLKAYRKLFPKKGAPRNAKYELQ